MKKFTKQLLMGVIALGLLTPVADQAISSNPQTTVNAKTRWHYLHYHGNKRYRYYKVAPMKYWNGDRWVRIKHNVRVLNFSSKGVDMAHIYVIGRRTLKRGSLIKGFYTFTTPGGFYITKARGFHPYSKYEHRHDASWVVYPTHHHFSNYWIKAVK